MIVSCEGGCPEASTLHMAVFFSAAFSIGFLLAAFIWHTIIRHCDCPSVLPHWLTTNKNTYTELGELSSTAQRRALRKSSSSEHSTLVGTRHSALLVELPSAVHITHEDQIQPDPSQRIRILI
uniref:Uncharacterized protein n=1 Tax=Octactis speculum TaxID=3111310 RepID=A0A7S2DKI6_9STRA